KSVCLQDCVPHISRTLVPDYIGLLQARSVDGFVWIQSLKALECAQGALTEEVEVVAEQSSFYRVFMQRPVEFCQDFDFLSALCIHGQSHVRASVESSVLLAVTGMAERNAISCLEGCFRHESFSANVVRGHFSSGRAINAPIAIARPNEPTPKLKATDSGL